MKIYHSFYELFSKRPIHSKKTWSSRRGALLRVEFDDGLVGYADCHPWEEFGDLPLQTQLDLLKNGRSTRLTARSIFFAKADAKARAKQTNLLESKKIPSSHYLITHLNQDSQHEVKQAWEMGFTHFKIKMGQNLSEEETWLKDLVKKCPTIKLRLDFNSKLTFEQLIYFLDRISSLLSAIDFIEDPFNFHYGQWRHAQMTFHVPLAADEYYKEAYGHPEAAKVLIMKPAIQTVKPIDISQRIIMTSYLDHPIGQVSAAYIASQAGVTETCGLLSHHVYQANPFAEMIRHQGSKLQPVQGYGLGFDELLKKQTFLAIA